MIIYNVFGWTKNWKRFDRRKFFIPLFENEYDYSSNEKRACLSREIKKVSEYWKDSSKSYVLIKEKRSSRESK